MNYEIVTLNKKAVVVKSMITTNYSILIRPYTDYSNMVLLLIFTYLLSMIKY